MSLKRRTYVLGGAITPFIGKKHPDFIWKRHPDFGKRENPTWEELLQEAREPHPRGVHHPRGSPGAGEHRRGCS